MTRDSTIDMAIARLEAALAAVDRAFSQIRQDEAAAVAARARADEMRAERNRLAGELKVARTETEQIAKGRDRVLAMIAEAEQKVSRVLSESAGESEAQV